MVSSYKVPLLQSAGSDLQSLFLAFAQEAAAAIASLLSPRRVGSLSEMSKIRCQSLEGSVSAGSVSFVDNKILIFWVYASLLLV